MLSYALRRLAATIPVMGVVALFVFSLLFSRDPARWPLRTARITHERH